MIKVEGIQVVSDPIQSFFIGTYTDEESKGIYEANLNISNGRLSVPVLVIPSSNPTFLAFSADKKFLLAANENNEKGSIESFVLSQKGEPLKRIYQVSSGGAHPCHVSANADRFVLGSNYTGGSIALFRIDNNGIFKMCDLKEQKGSGPVKGRQEKAHVHSALFEPETDRIFVADLGTDKINIYRLDKVNQKLEEAPVSEIKLPSGSGPRHMIFNHSKKLLYIACELSNTVSVVDLNQNGTYSVITTLSTLPEDYSKESYVADIHLSKDGRFLYVSNRGPDTIAIFTIDQKNGELELIAQESTRGVNPRNFTFSPDENYLLVANQTSQNIVAFKRDSKTGKLTFADEVKALKPVCILFC
jgi:6-phosphogluconolactonase